MILFKIWGEMSEDCLTTPTCAALSDSGIRVLDNDTGFKKDSMGGIYLSLLSTNATNLVLSGTKIVLVLLAYWSLRDAKRLSEKGR